MKPPRRADVVVDAAQLQARIRVDPAKLDAAWNIVKREDMKILREFASRSLASNPRA